LLQSRADAHRLRKSVRANEIAPSAHEGGTALETGRGPQKLALAVVRLMQPDFASSEAAFELPWSRRRAVSDEPESQDFQWLMLNPACRSDWRSSPPAEKCALCIGHTVGSQADMGMKLRWRKRFCVIAPSFRMR
jgi:hypothetical protein